MQKYNVSNIQSNYPHIDRFLPLLSMQMEPIRRKTGPLSLKLNFSWTLVGNVVFAGCQWLTLVAIAKVGTTEVVGQYALALAIVTPIMMLTGLQMRALQSTDAAREFSFGDYLGLRIITVTIALAAVMAAIGWANHVPAVIAVTIALAISKSFDSVSEVLYGFFQQNERMDSISKSLILHGVLQLMVFVATIVTTDSLLFAVVGMAAVSLLVLVFYDWPLGKELTKFTLASDDKKNANVAGFMRPRWDASRMRKITWLGLPLSLVVGANSLTGSVPRYFIADAIDQSALGIFAALFYLTIAGSTIMGAMGHSASPRLAKLYLDKDIRGFTKLLWKLIAIAISTGILGLLVGLTIGRELLTFLYQPEYANHMTTFLWLMGATSPMYITTMLGVGITAMRRFHIQVPLPLVNLVFTTVAAAVLIPKFGLEGSGQVVFISACFAMIASFTVLLICLRKK